jgi:hypothetical protein
MGAFRKRSILSAIFAVSFSMLASFAHAQTPASTDAPAQPAAGEAQDAAPGMMQPLVATEAGPSNQLTPFAPHWIRTPQGRTLGFGYGLEKMLSQNWDVEVDSSFDSNSPHQGSHEAGLGAVSMLTRFVFINQADMLATIAPTMTLGVGSLGQATGVDNAGLALLWRGRGGALPENWNLGYFRALEVHADLAYSRILKDGSGDDISFNTVFNYSLPYMQYLMKTELPKPVRNLCFFTEFNFDAVVSGSSQGAPTLYTTPGISYLTDNYQVSAGVQLPLNHAADQAQQVALIGSIAFSLDSVPVLGFMPL